MNMRILSLLLAGALASHVAHAETADPNAGTGANTCAVNIKPRTQEYPWMSIGRWKRMHEDQLALADKGDVDLMFIGDSITEGWPRAIWNANFGAYKAGNFGIGGDNTGNVLWRLQDKRMARLAPKAIVLLIGVNNLGLCDETPEQAFPGIKAVVTALRKQYPAARILLNAVLPTGESATSERRQNVVTLNKMVATLDDGRHVVFRDYGASFVRPDGAIGTDIMGDYLHLTPKGYTIWADAMLPDVHALMK
ncbi:GDSL-type esterase/lipase family protein [Massilia pseudoviolaceinigra]|uniref:GDSL-type esterase/lipase family protein n=1 Tax=Massilia pseudoviolaceinigra TaxID=3057165 RepID=UPI002796A3C8|nr:GDSL-type esterase/lipase family protein [Massilia sp. CCM 9206]MDQ1923962.1 GDSL-type esterase/lipase family protein [Massilia sp. CCM 9206]